VHLHSGLPCRRDNKRATKTKEIEKKRCTPRHPMKRRSSPRELIRRILKVWCNPSLGKGKKRRLSGRKSGKTFRQTRRGMLAALSKEGKQEVGKGKQEDTKNSFRLNVGTKM